MPGSRQHGNHKGSENNIALFIFRGWPKVASFFTGYCLFLEAADDAAVLLGKVHQRKTIWNQLRMFELGYAASGIEIITSRNSVKIWAIWVCVVINFIAHYRGKCEPFPVWFCYTALTTHSQKRFTPRTFASPRALRSRELAAQNYRYELPETPVFY